MDVWSTPFDGAHVGGGADIMGWQTDLSDLLVLAGCDESSWAMTFRSVKEIEFFSDGYVRPEVRRGAVTRDSRGPKIEEYARRGGDIGGLFHYVIDAREDTLEFLAEPSVEFQRWEEECYRLRLAVDPGPAAVSPDTRTLSEGDFGDIAPDDVHLRGFQVLGRVVRLCVGAPMPYELRFGVEALRQRDPTVSNGPASQRFLTCSQGTEWAHTVVSEFFDTELMGEEWHYVVRATNGCVELLSDMVRVVPLSEPYCETVWDSQPGPQGGGPFFPDEYDDR